MQQEEHGIADEIGTIMIAEEVVAVIAGMAVMEVDGVNGMSGGIAGGLADILGRKNLARGVKVTTTGSDSTIDLYIIVDYGCRIPDVAWNVQERVKRSVEEMTGMNVSEVNIHIQGVSFEKEQKKEQLEEIPKPDAK